MASQRDGTRRAPRLRQLRKRAEAWLASPAGQAVPAALFAAYLRRGYAGTAWEMEGRDAFAVDAAAGPVIVAIWHGRLMSGGVLWDRAWGRLTTLSSHQYPGRLAGQTMRHFGLDTRAMHDRRSNRAESLALARAIRGGMSVGIAADGPLGPARVAKTVPLDWARLTGAPVWCLGFSLTRYRQLDSWDRMILPRPGGRGCLVYRRFGTVARGADIAAARDRLQEALDAVTLAADRRLGHPGPIA